MAWVLFFDGDCAFCAVSVRWVRRVDRRRSIVFEPLQGDRARQFGLAPYSAQDGTLVLLRTSDDRLFLRSDALIELARALGGGWRAFTLARFIPRPWRDWLYRCFAKNRFRLVGKSSCRLQTEQK